MRRFSKGHDSVNSSLNRHCLKVVLGQNLVDNAIDCLLNLTYDCVGTSNEADHDCGSKSSATERLGNVERSIFRCRGGDKLSGVEDVLVGLADGFAWCINWFRHEGPFLCVPGWLKGTKYVVMAKHPSPGAWAKYDTGLLLSHRLGRREQAPNGDARWRHCRHLLRNGGRKFRGNGMVQTGLACVLRALKEGDDDNR